MCLILLESEWSVTTMLQSLIRKLRRYLGNLAILKQFPCFVVFSASASII